MELSRSHAEQLDKRDPLGAFRSKFLIPENENGQRIYFLGNSLGLQPKSTQTAIDFVLQQWANEGVESFHKGERPWLNLHDQLVQPVSTIVGAHKQEVSIMGQLTVNIHLMMVSFYRPNGKRRKILMEAKAFPSDQYAVHSFVSHMGLNPDEDILLVHPAPGTSHIDETHLLDVIEQHRDELALVFLGGVNYYSGQLFDIKTISAAAKKAGAMVGWDLAHAAGNVELRLHDWQVDFACWCSYKYMNGGPGAVAGIFVHSNHLHDPACKKLTGWWGYKREERFKMHDRFQPEPDATAWQVSTPSMLLYACLKSSLILVEEAGWSSILSKQHQLVKWIKAVISDLRSPLFTCITPDSRGCQVSLLFHEKGRMVYDRLFEKGFMVDWREPNVIRLAPVPLYNTFTEVWMFREAMKEILHELE